MANRYGNLTPSKKISEDFQEINIGFDQVQVEMDENIAQLADQDARIDLLVSGDSGLAANEARESTPYGVIYDSLKDRVDHTDEVVIAIQASTEQLEEDVTSIQTDILKHGNYIEGMEYLWRYHTLISTNSDPKAIFTGDSTTEGTGVVSSANFINIISKTFLESVGKYITTVNAGHGGKLSIDWINTYLASDLAQNPDLYVIRWGLNDAVNPTSTRLETFKENMEAGLATIRASKDTSELSIILMTPNTANNRVGFVADTIPILKQLAREYKCCFVNTFTYMQDYDASWMDSYLLHPTDVANHWIISLMGELLCPSTMRKGTVLNVPGVVGVKAVTDAPSTYAKGVSIHFAGGTFPQEGLVTTTKTEDNVLLQINASYKTGITNAISFRRGYANTGVTGTLNNTWDDWLTLGGAIAKQSLTLQGTWAQYASDFADVGYWKDVNGFVHLTGVIKSGSTTQFSAITNALPAGCRPAKNTIFNDKIVVASNGGVLVWVIADNSMLSLAGISFKAEL